MLRCRNGALCAGRGGRWSSERGLDFRGETLADVGSRGLPIYGAVGIPVGAMTHAFTALATARFSTKCDLLMIRDLTVCHMLLPWASAPMTPIS